MIQGNLKNHYFGIGVKREGSSKLGLWILFESAIVEPLGEVSLYE